jgi:hypothetical protein
MTYLLISLACLQAPPPSPPPTADPVIEAPRPEAPAWVEFKAEVGKLLRLTVPGTPAAVKWTLIDTAGADLESCDGGKRCSFVASAEGRYRLLAQVGDVVHRVQVTVGKPTPPAPPPPPPAPVDTTLRDKLQAAYTADPLPLAKRKEQLADLVELYKQAVTLAGDTSITSAADMVKRLKDASAALGVTGLESMRKAIAAEIAVAFPADVPFDANNRAKALAVLTKVRDAIAAVAH